MALREKSPAVINHDDQAILVDPHDIEDGPRIGLFWPEKADAIGALMRADGQNEPIKIRKNSKGTEKTWLLVAGRHRKHGAIMHGIAQISALLAKGSAEQCREIEASENMDRRDIGPIEKAMFVRARADIYEGRFFDGQDGKSAQQVGQSKRWSSKASQNILIDDEKHANLEADHSAATIAGLYGWQDDAAEAMEMSSRSLRDYLFIYRTVVMVAGTDESQGGRVHALARHPLGQKRKSLIEIGKIKDTEARKAVIDLIASDHDHQIASVTDAKIKWGLKPARPPAPEGQSKYMANATSNLDRLTASSWISLAPVIAEKIKPSALKAMRDAIDARIAAGEGK